MVCVLQQSFLDGLILSNSNNFIAIVLVRLESILGLAFVSKAARAEQRQYTIE